MSDLFSSSIGPYLVFLFLFSLFFCFLSYSVILEHLLDFFFLIASRSVEYGCYVGMTRYAETATATYGNAPLAMVFPEFGQSAQHADFSVSSNIIMCDDRGAYDVPSSV